jgi:predicted DNA binding protein
MWIAKIKFNPRSDYSIFAPMAKEHGISMVGYPVTHYKKKDKNFYVAAGSIFGSEENKKKFVSELKKDKRIIKFENKKNFFIVLYRQEARLSILFDPSVILTKPIVIDKGEEIYEVGFFDKKDLIKYIKDLKKNYKGLYEINIEKIYSKKLSSLFLLKMLPDLTDKQREAIDLAIKHGYYNSPRKISVQELAKISGLSFSTFQVHLRKSEEKLIPNFFE